MQYVIVQVPNDPTQAAAILNTQYAANYVFVAWLIPPQPITPGQGIFRSTTP